MLRIITQESKLLFSYKKDLDGKYVIYDQTLNQFAKVGNNISRDLMKKFVTSANPKISRQQNYMPKVSHLLRQILPHFKNNADFYAKQGTFSFILALYSTMNIHRKLIFDLIELKCQKFESQSILYWFQIYSSFVDMHHQSSTDFKIKLKNYLHSQLRSELFHEKYSRKVDHFQITIKTLKFMLMDRQLNLNQCEQLLAYIEEKIIPKIDTISLADRNLGQNLAFLNELIKIHSLKFKTQKFKKVLEEAKNFQISQKMQSQKSFVKKQNYILSLKEENFPKPQNVKFQHNPRIINYGQSSVFQTIFSRILKEKGYEFEKNKFIGIFQYDVLVKGKKQKIYRPFQNINSQKFEPISSQEWSTFKSMNDYKKIKVDEILQNSIILNLNGPYHYIDSDVYGDERVTRTDEMKGMFLKSYGYKNFNIVHHGKWQEVHEKGVQIQSYIQKLLAQNLLTKI